MVVSRYIWPKLAVAVVLAILACTLPIEKARAQTPSVTLSVPSTTSLTEGDSSTDIAVTATLSAQRSTETTVQLSLSGMATEGTDYQAQNPLPSITIPASQTSASATLVVSVTDDNFWEGPEDIRVDGTASGGLTVTGATLVLEDNDSKPQINLRIEGPELHENQNAVQTLNITAQFIGQSTVATDTVITPRLHGSAIIDKHYRLPDGIPNITIPAGEISHTVGLQVQTIDNDDRHNPWYIQITASATDRFGNAFKFHGNLRVVIVEDDPLQGIVTSATFERQGTKRSFIREAWFQGTRVKKAKIFIQAALAGEVTSQEKIEISPYRSGPSANRCDFLEVQGLSKLVIPKGMTKSQRLELTLVIPRGQEITNACLLSFLTHVPAGYRALTGDQVTIVPSGNPALYSVDMRPINSRILVLGQNIVFHFDFTRAFQITRGSLSLKFKMGRKMETATCGKISNWGRLSCSYHVRKGDRDLDGFSPSEFQLMFPSNARVVRDQFDRSVRLTVDATIPVGDRAKTFDYVVHGERQSFDFLASLRSLQEGVGPKRIEITANLVGGPIANQEVRIPVVVVNGTAGDADYKVEGTPTIIVGAGELSGKATLTFTPTNDGVKEARVETVRLEAGESSESVFVTGVDLNILDAPSVRLSVSPKQISEHGGAQSVTVTAALADAADSVRPRAIPVRLAFAGSAGIGDYSVGPHPAVVTIPPNQRSGTVTLTVTPVDDNLLEGDETIQLSGSTLGLPVISPDPLTLADDETEPQVVLAVDPNTIQESDSEGTEVTVSAILAPDVVLPDAATVVALTLGGTATHGSNQDYTASWNPETPRIEIPQGKRAANATVTLTVTPRQDDTAEGDETIVVEGTASTGLDVDVRKSAIRLVDDDIPSIVLAPSPLEVTEGGMTSYRVSLARKPAENVTVRMTTSLASTDVRLDNTVLVFTTDNWNKPQPVTVSATDDDDAAADDPVVLVHTASGGAYTGVSAQLTVTIKEDESPNVVVSPTTLPILEGASGTYTVVLTSEPTKNVMVTMATSLTGTDLSVSPSPTVLTFDDENWDEPQTVRVNAAADADAVTDPPTTFTHTVASEGDYKGASASSVTVTITETTVPVLSISSPSVTEGNSGTTDLAFVVTLGSTSDKQVTVAYADPGTGTATSGTDYAAVTGGTLTFAAMETSKTVTVGVTGDMADEPDETVVLQLSSPSNATLNGGGTTLVGTGTITDDDDAPVLGIDSPSVDEGDSGTATLTYTVTLSAASGRQVRVDYADKGTGTAASGTDYAAVASGSLTFEAGQTRKTIGVTVNGDAVDEPDETVVLTLSNPTNATVATADGTGTITDDDDAPVLGIDSPSVDEGDSGTATLTYTVTLSAASGRQVRVDYTDKGTGTAASGTDYAAVASGSLTFEAGQTRKTIGVTVNGDAVDEPDETVVLTLSNPTNATVATADGTGTITDDDDAPTGAIALALNPSSVGESASATPVTVTARLPGTTTRSEATEITVSIGAGGDTAAEGTDYAAVSDVTLTIGAGQMEGTQTFSIDPSHDVIDEGTGEEVTVAGSISVSGLSVTPAKFTITDDDAVSWTVGVAPGAIAENGGTATVTVSTGGATFAADQAVSLALTGTATKTEDYTIGSESLTLAAGQTSVTTTVTGVEDTMDDDAETVVITASVGGSAVGAAQTLTITDDDDAPMGAIALALNPSSVGEDATATPVTVTARLPGTTTRSAPTEITVSIGAGGDAAAEGTDYAAVADVTLTIAAGQMEGTQTFSIDPAQDAVDEGAGEAVTVAGTTSVSGLSVTSATLTITDDDAAPTVSLALSHASISENGGVSTVTATLSGASSEAVTVAVTAAAVSPAVAADFELSTTRTLTIAAGATASTGAVTITGVDNAVDAPAKTVTVSGTAGGGHGVADPTAETLTITDDDAAPTVSLLLSHASISESGGVSTVTATLSGASSAEVTVAVTAAAVSPAVAADFELSTTRTLTIAAGATASTGAVTITGVDNAVDAPAKTVTVSGTASGGHGVADPTAETLTITDDDDAPTGAIALALNPSSVGESASATPVTVTARLPGTTTRSEATEITVSIGAGGDTAAEGTDYAAVSDVTLTIGAGQMEGTQTFSIDPSHDVIDEGTGEEVTVAGSISVSGLSVTPAKFTITDDDAVSWTVGVAPGAIAENGGTATVTVSTGGVTFAADQAVSLALTGTATKTADYTIGSESLTLAAGQTSVTTTVTGVEDTMDDDAETVVITASVGGSAVGAAQTLTITDDDDAPMGAIALALNPSSVGEDATATPVTVTATLPGTTTRSAPTEITVSIGAGGDAAAEGTDYAAVADVTLTIAAGQMEGTQTFSIDPAQDAVDEGAGEAVTVAGSTSVSGLSVSSTMLTITDDDATPTVSLSLSHASISENGGVSTVTATLSGASSEAVTVAVAAMAVSPAVAADFELSTNTTLTIAAGATSSTGTVTITGVDNAVDAPAKTVTVSGTAGGGHGVAHPAAKTLTITDDDATPTVTLTLDPSSISENGGVSTVTATLSGASSEAVTVEVTAAAVSPAVAGDFDLSTNTTLTIAAGATASSGAVTITGVDNSVDAPAKTVTVSGTAGGGHGVADPTAETLTITDDDATPTVSLTLAPSSISENGGVSTVTATLSGASSEAVTVEVSAAAVAPAVAGDFDLSTNTTLTIAAGATSSSGTVTITGVDNSVDAPNKTVTVSGTAAGGHGVAHPTAKTLTITDDDAAPAGAIALALNPSSVAEGASAVTVTVTATLPGTTVRAEATEITVSIGADGDAAAEGTDYAAVPDVTLTIAAGQMAGTQTFSIDPSQDVIDEGAGEAVTVAGSISVSGLSVTPAKFTITDDDAVSWTVGVAPGAIAENGGTATVTVSTGGVTFAADQAVSLALTGTATKTADYTIGSESLTLAAGQTSVTTTVTGVDDTLDDDAETVVITASVGGSAVGAAQTLTITDDDDAPTGAIALALNPSSVGEDATATPVTVTATLPGTTTRSAPTEITVSIGAGGDAAAEGTDYAAVADVTLTIAAGQMEGTQTFSIDPAQDAVDEGAGEAVTVAGTTSVSGLSVTSATLTITDDDAAPTVSLALSHASISENGGVSTVTATLSGASSEAVTVAVTAAAVSPAVAADFELSTTRTLTIAAGATASTGAVTITGVDNAVDAPAKTVTVSGTAGGGHGVADPTAETLTITDDDAAPTVSLLLSHASISENGGVSTVTATLSGASSEAVTVAVTAAAVSPAVAADFELSTTRTLTIAAGATASTGAVTITGVDNAVDAPAKTVTVSGTAGGGHGVADPTAETLTITDDDAAPTVSLLLSHASISENGGVSTVTATLSGASSEAVTVAVTAAAVSPAVAADFELSTTRTLTIAAGATASTGAVTITGVDNAVDAPAKTVTVSGTASGGHGVADPTAETLTITDDDDAPTGAIALALNPSSVGESATATTVTVTATLPGTTTRSEATEITVSIGAGGDTAAEGTDYAAVSDVTLTIGAGQMEGTQTFSIDPSHDVIDEGTGEEVTVAGSISVSGLSVTPAKFTITDDDAVSWTVGVAPGAIAENGGTATVTVSTGGVTFAADQAVSLALTGTATKTADYTIGSESLTLAAGQTSVTTTVTGVDDTLDDDAETVVITASVGGSAVGAAQTLTITDDDDAPTGAIALALGPTSVSEDASATTVTVTATLPGTTRRSEATEITVSVGAGGDAAAEGTDYAAVADVTLTIGAGQMAGTAMFSIDPSEDAIDEGAGEAVTVAGTTSVSGLSVSSAMLTITDDDATPTVTLTLDPASISENGAVSTVTATLSGASSEAVTVAVTAMAVSPAVAADFDLSTNTTLTIAAGATASTGTVTITGVDNAVNAPAKTVTVSGTAGGGHGVADPTAKTLTITDDDAAPAGAIALALNPSSVGEGASATTVTVTATLPGATTRSEATEITVSIGADGDAAAEGTDYAAVADVTLTIAAGQMAGTAMFSIDPSEDAIDEGAGEAVTVAGTTSVSGLSVSSATLRITDDDATPTVTLTLAPSSISENGGVSTVTASLSGASSAEVTVAVTAMAVSPAVAADFDLSTNTTLTIAAGATASTGTVTITGVDNAVDAPAKTVTVSGTAGGGHGVANPTAETLTITDDDDAPMGAIALALNPSSVSEGASATTVTVTATLPGATTRSEATEITVSIGADGDAAAEGTDYAAVADVTLTIAAGEMEGTQTFSIDPAQDEIDEGAGEALTVAGTTSVSGLSVSSATLTITDDDATPTVTLTLAPSSISENGGVSTVTASLSGASSAEVTVAVTAMAVSPAVAADFDLSTNTTLTIAAGETASTGTVTITGVDNSVDAPAKTVTVSGTAGGGHGVADPTAETLTITDNDGAPTAVTLGVSPTSAAESAAATSITVTATLVGSQRTSDTAVTVSRTGGTATSGTDYAAISNFTVTIAAGSSSGTATLSFEPTEDTVDEDDETVVLTGTASGLTAGTATLTITDNDDAPTAVTLAVSPNSVLESASATSITVTASLVGSRRTSDTAVTVSRTGGTATSGTDYAAISSFTVTIAAGEMSGTATLSFVPTEDTFDEDNETVVLTGTASGLATGTATLTITDNDNDLRPTFSPANNTTTTNAGTDITLTFPEAIRKDNANADFADADLSGVLTLKRTGATGADIPYAATINSARTIITVSPAADLPEGAVHVGISNAYFNAAANQGQAASATFTVDTTGPAQPAFDPANAATVTNAGRNITLTFREVIRRTTSGADFTTEAQLKAILALKAGGSSGADIPYAASINSGRTVITIEPSASLSDGDVHVAVTDGYCDMHGNRGHAASATFTVDTTGVSPPAFDPPDNAAVADAGTNITLTFDEAIRRTGGGADFATEAQLKAILALKAGGSSGADIPYAASINSGRTVITVEPSASLSDGDIHVAVTDGYYDVHGNRGRAASATFTVDTTLAGTPPLVRSKPEPLQLALWTDKPGYVAGETVRLFHTLHRHDDHGQYRAFAWLEPAAGGQRRYLAPLSADAALHAEAVDTRGLPEHASRARLLPRADRALAFEGEAPAPGLWRFVLELRPGSADEQYEKPADPMRTRRAWAAFTVAERNQRLNRRGFDREIRADLTLRSDTIHYLGHQLFVRDGATLTIEPGTVVLGWGRNTAIIVETGGRIVAEGTREAPVVLGCSAPVGQREPGCWGGLRILGKAPVTRLEGVVPGVLPAGRAVYGGADAEDSSGLLRHVRVEFAGAAGDGPLAADPALGLYGAGSGTVLDHVQTHASLGDGFAFHGGASVCDHCVASGSGGAGLSWRRGWRGGASHLYVQHGSRGLDGLDGRNDDRGHDLEPRSLPTLSNVTLVHTFAHGTRERKAVALRLSAGSGVRARDLLATRFLAGAIDARGRSALLFDEGRSSVSGALLHLNGDRHLEGGIRDAVEFIAGDPQLRDERWFANPDPRPKAGSPALHGDGEGYIGAFGREENWLEEWTVFGPESAYDTREGTADER